MVKRDFFRNIFLIIIGINLVLLLRLFFFSTHEISKNEANNFLKSGDFVTVQTRTKPAVKDFVVYKVDKKEYVGRVIATSGDSVTFMDDIFYLNAMIEEEPYIDNLKTDYHNRYGFEAYFTSDFTLETLTQSNITKIPKGYFLVLNDNRQNTKDSREFGLISQKQIKGVVNFRILPLDQFGFIENE
ncbi:signal peptidase I [Streptococcus pacificus]|uniref:Signal peptidase I n=1 Tax=Streptococcus pacificus TaxID=2740577 RepID=A0ABS0ZIR8_9STRE|nr:signal peptidase I [Streptococcus pacificus]MBJ8325608.1 signal peptidase I [Streptococcus pacificus]